MCPTRAKCKNAPLNFLNVPGVASSGKAHTPLPSLYGHGAQGPLCCKRMTLDRSSLLSKRIPTTNVMLRQVLAARSLFKTVRGPRQETGSQGTRLASGQHLDLAEIPVTFRLQDSTTSRYMQHQLRNRQPGQVPLINSQSTQGVVIHTACAARTLPNRSEAALPLLGIVVVEHVQSRKVLKCLVFRGAAWLSQRHGYIC